MKTEHALQHSGFVSLPTGLSERDVSALRGYCDSLHGALDQAGIRSLLAKAPQMAAFLNATLVMSTIKSLLGPDAIIARSILFDKNRHANWDVAWHQDTTIAVEQKISLPGFGPWSIKDGIPHVRPPAEVLERMLTVRVHLDYCGAKNGALRVIPGSHRQGILTASQIRKLADTSSVETCEVPEGGVFLMRPLLIHSSKKSLLTDNSRRRVIHLEFASFSLPGGLTWAKS